MKEAVYKKCFSVRSYEVDSKGHVRPTAILNYLQEAAGDHARMLGIAVRDLLPQGLTWVISRMHLTITSSVTARDELTVRTWPSARDGRFTVREFELIAADGRNIGAATASFAVLDIASRRPVNINKVLPLYPIIERRAIDDSFSSIPYQENYDSEVSFQVGRSDLDINNHVNNVVYVDWALEAVPKAIADENQLIDLEIAYRAEALYGEKIVARASLLPYDDRTAFLHKILRRDDGTELARVISRWGKFTSKIS